MLGGIERRIGTRQHLLDAAGARRAICNTDADGGADPVTGDYRTGGFEGSADAFSGDRGVVRRPQNHDCKFLTAKPPDHVMLAHRPLDALGECTQGRIPDSMAKTVVDLLEVIEVEHQHAETIVLARPARDHKSRQFHEAATIEKTSERVGSRRRLVKALGPFLHHHQHDKRRADDV